MQTASADILTRLEATIASRRNAAPDTSYVAQLNARGLPLIRNRPDSELEGFELCGADGRWVFADARIEGDAVSVSSPGVPRPVAVRYGWADNPLCNLENGAGLPAAPFRTDDFPLSTAAVRY